MILLADFAPSVTRGAFRRAGAALAQEIAIQGTYGRLSAALLLAQYFDGAGADSTLLWANLAADVRVSGPVEQLLLCLGARTHRARVDLLGQTDDLDTFGG